MRVRRVTLQAAAGARTFHGVVQADADTRLSFRVPGTITAIPVKLGDRLTAGTVAATLERHDFELREQHARAALDEALASARQAKRDFERIAALFADRCVSAAEQDRVRARAETTAAKADAARKQLELARRQLSYTILRVPTAGTVARLLAEENENVVAGQPVLLLNEGDRMEVRAAVPEDAVSTLKKSALVEVTVDAVADRTFAGTVDEIGTAPAGAGAAYPLVVVIADEDSRLRPGMSATVRLRDTGAETAAVIVPSFAVREDRHGRFVFIAETDGAATDGNLTAVARRRPVAVGTLTDAGIEILTGLEPGELLITAGVTLLADGQPVRPAMPRP
ncbi:MAG: efflux RND transporter periplasmic adaptor subunit [Deltaproteobacteria bacterium]|nr:efflux RND transporter periplasmic adaptor subunit [Candidatus Anaeroferrophillacea bacterium]